MFLLRIDNLHRGRGGIEMNVEDLNRLLRKQDPKVSSPIREGLRIEILIRREKKRELQSPLFLKPELKSEG